MRDESVAISSASFYRQWAGILIRHWLPNLKPIEFCLLAMIFDRTLGWGKEWETISLKQFRTGVYSKDQKACFHGGVGAARSTTVLALNNLESYGCIKTRGGHKGPNDAKAFSINFEWNESMLKEPKKQRNSTRGLPDSKPRRGGSEIHTPPVRKSDHPPSGNRTPKGDIIKGEEIKELPDKSGGVREVVEQIRNRGREKRSLASLDLLSRARLSLDDLNKIWKSAFSETFPEVDCILPKKKETHTLSAYVKRYMVGQPAQAFGTYLDWVLRNWRVILIEEFHWMADAPQYPAPFFLVKFSSRFESAFFRRREIEAVMALPLRDRRIRELTMRGTPYEVAEEQVDRELATSRNLKAIQDESRKLEKQRHNLARQQFAPVRRRPVIDRTQPVPDVSLDEVADGFPAYEG